MSYTSEPPSRREILEILRGLLEDEMGDKITDMRFSPHVVEDDPISLSDVNVSPSLSPQDN